MIARSCSKLLFTDHILISPKDVVASLRESALKVMLLKISSWFDLSVATKENSFCMEKILQISKENITAKYLLSGE